MSRSLTRRRFVLCGLTAAAVPKVGFVARVANSIFRPGRLVVLLVAGALGFMLVRNRRDRRRREEEARKRARRRDVTKMKSGVA